MTAQIELFPSAKRLTAVWLLAALVPTLLGCGPKQAADPNRTMVSGVVNFDGKPLPAGTITFTSVDSYIAATVSIGEGGHYATSRAPLGTSTVTVDTESLKYGYPAGYVQIPAKYADASTSGFKVDVKAGENENVNFDLKK